MTEYISFTKEVEEGLASGSGGMYQSDVAHLVTKRWSMEEDIMDAAIEEAKADYEKSKEQFKLAMRILTEHMERATQVIQKVTS